MTFKIGDTGKTREGRPYRVICVDKAGESPVVALVHHDDGDEGAIAYLQNGRVHPTSETPFDLLREPEKVTLWFNLWRYENGEIVSSASFPTEDAATTHRLRWGVPACIGTYSATFTIKDAES